jgi:hypothetical protein
MLIAAAQRVEHYEIAGYGTARAYAKSMGNREAVNLLNETLKEEEMADKLLSRIAIQIQKELLAQEGESEEGADEQMGRYASEARGMRGGSRTNGRGRSAGVRSAAGSKKKVAARGGNGGGRSASQRGGRTSTRSGGGASGSQVTTDHDQIRSWAEERGAHPACVRGTGRRGDTGMIRLDFPGYSGGESLEEISWDEFFEKFDEQGLALVYQDKTARGQKSNFNKLISRGAGGARRGSRSR